MLHDDLSESSSQMEDNLCFGEDEIVLGDVSWELVKGQQKYEGDPQSELLELVDRMENVRVQKSGMTQRVMWVRKQSDPLTATIHTVEPVPSKICDNEEADTDPRFEPSRVLRFLEREKDGNGDVLWTLLRLRHPFLSSQVSSPLRDVLNSVSPSLLSSQEPLLADPTPAAPTGSWSCSCGKVNMGFKAFCEVCAANAPSGWWRMDNLPSTSLEVPDLKMAPKLAKHKVFRRSKTVGWTLRNEDLVILSVEQEGPAAEAGLFPGMKLIAIDSQVCADVQDVQKVLNFVGNTFEVTISQEAVTNLRSTQSLTQDDGVVVVVMNKLPTEKMGTTWISSECLTLQKVDSNTPADAAGLTALVGWRLTHINNNLVFTSGDILREAAGQQQLTLFWARPTQQGFRSAGAGMMQGVNSMMPGNMPMMMPQMNLPMGQNHMGMPTQPLPVPNARQQQPVVLAVYAPSLLWVMAPERVQHCGGLYRLQPEQINEQPFWKHEVNHLILYSSQEGLWCISDSPETGNGWVFSMVHSNAAMPDAITNWEVMGEQDREIQVVSQLPIPGALQVTASTPKLELIKGVYQLVRATEEVGGLPFQVVNGMPVWQCPERQRWLYSSRKGTWFVTDDAQDFVRGGGVISGKAGHGGDMPNKQKMWVTRDNVDRPEVHVTLLSAQNEVESVTTQSEVEPKTNVTASVHENAVWRYEDVGGYSLAAYLKKNNNFHNLLWVAPSGKQGWIGIDLSNEDERGNLVRHLTELVDQECITVCQPIVAGVSVSLTQKVYTAEGEVIEAGARGQVVSVVMGRTPLGNAPPRMAKVNFYGTKTVTVSYGQVEPLQGTFERGAKVRVLAVDAVAVVDAETIPTGGVGVKGKYRVKYATGKTYHVRNFALITAEKPWGEGDEVPVGVKVREGANFALAEDIVFDTVDALPKGAVGVVTHVGSTTAVEVLAGGLLFVCNQSQLVMQSSPLKKGVQVSPVLQEHLPGKWTCGRVESVSGNKCKVMTPNGTITENVADLRVNHYLVGQKVFVKGFSNPGADWIPGVVEKVLPSGVPLIRSEGVLDKHWFAMQQHDPAAPSAAYTTKENDLDGEEDPLVSMGSYITVDSAMLCEAEIMRRKWFESQRLQEIMHLKLQSLQEASRISKMEVNIYNVMLHKASTERMGTVFHLEDVLVLTSVGSGSAAERSGVGRFVGRQLISIDGIPVKTTNDIVSAAEGKTSMDLTFQKTPGCPAGHPMEIVLNRTGSKRCPGCCKQYSNAYFACKTCWYDLCGSCGQRLEEKAASAEKVPAATTTTTTTTSTTASRRLPQPEVRVKLPQAPSPTPSTSSAAYAASPASSSQIGSTSLSSGLSAAAAVRTEEKAPTTMFSGGSWGMSAFNDGEDTAAPSGWGATVEAGSGGAIGRRGAQTAEDTQQQQLDELSRNSLMSLLDCIQEEDRPKEKKQPEGDADFSLSNILNRVHDLPTSPSTEVGIPDVGAEFLASLSETGTWVHGATSERRIY